MFYFITATGFGPVGYIESRDAQYLVGARQVAQIRQMEPPAIGARSAIVLDGTSGTVLFGQHEHDRLPMASMTKMMTALLAIESGRLDETFRIQVNAADYPDSSLMGLFPGEELTLEDLLYGLMLPSGNDAAVAIAQAISGSEKAFVAAMNRRAAELGLIDTHFVNPHGLHDPNHYSSAYDMAQLARYAMRNPVFARIVGTQDHTVQGIATYQLHNTNRLLADRPDVRGVKTGYEDAAGRCLTAVAVRGNHQVFVVVMNSPDYFGETSMLIDHYFDSYTWLPLTPSPTPLYDVIDEPAAAPMEALLPKWQVPLLRAQLVDDASPRLIFSIDGTIYGQIPLKLN